MTVTNRITVEIKIDDTRWDNDNIEKLSESRNRPEQLRKRLMKFIGDFSDWDVKNDLHWTKCAREMVMGCNGGNPILLDPFAGGGSIPLEGLRIGAEVYASDINPVPIILNKLQLEILPHLSNKNLEIIQKEVNKINEILEKELSTYFPIPPQYINQEIPIGYLCARTIRCEGVNCGLIYPLVSSPWVVNSDTNKICYSFSKGKERVQVNIINNPNENDVPQKTVTNGNAICPICGYRTPAPSVKRQLQSRNGGTDDSEMLVVISKPYNGKGEFLDYR